MQRSLCFSVFCMVLQVYRVEWMQRMCMRIQYDCIRNEIVLRGLAEKYHVPGFTCTIIHNGAVQQTIAYGIRNSDPYEEMTGDTIFEAASLTKTVFALFVMRMIDQGVLHPDDTLYSLCPEVMESSDPRSRQCTVRHALSHGTGIVGWKDSYEYDPGTSFAYSGQGYYKLQRILENILQEDFCDYMNKEILVPLGMKDSYPVMCPEVLLKESHKFDEQGVIQPHRTWVDKEGIQEPNAAWSLYTTAQDYALFMLEILNEHGHLGEETFRIMTSMQNTADGAVNWGLGWGLCTADPDVLWHWGDNGCYRSFTAMDLRTKDGICIFCNSANGGKLCMELMRMVTGETYWNDVEQFIEYGE